MIHVTFSKVSKGGNNQETNSRWFFLYIEYISVLPTKKFISTSVYCLLFNSDQDGHGSHGSGRFEG